MRKQNVQGILSTKTLVKILRLNLHIIITIFRYNDNKDPKAIYQNKASKVYLYYDEGFAGWVSGPHKSNDQKFVMKIATK